MSKKSRILITNDDGIDAPGLNALFNRLQSIGDVIVVAPSVEQSAIGHAITMSDPLRVWRYERNGSFYGYAVNGTPADCVKIASWAILGQKPDVLVSGINLGANTGINTIYSGTVSAATEGAILGIPSFAISIDTDQDPDFQFAEKFACQLTRFLIDKGLPKGVCLNVNVPCCSEQEIRGISVTRQGLTVFEESFDKRVDPHGRLYYWLTGQKMDREENIEVDEGAVQAKMVSITPIHCDLTNYDFLEALRGWDLRI
jgi:5'-nucleotidase